MLKAFADGLVFGETYGADEPQVVWLHGWGRSSADFRSAGEKMASRGVSSVALDLPGFGASPAPTVACGARGYADLVIDAIREATHHRPAVIVGHSFGGRIAAVLVANHPELFCGVVFAGTPLVAKLARRRGAPWPYRMIRAAARWRLVSPATLDAAKKKYGSADYRNASGVMRDVLVMTVNESYESELAKISLPVTLVWGENDTDVPLEVAQRAATILRGDATVRAFAGRGHLVPLDNPDALVVAASELL